MFSQLEKFLMCVAFLSALILSALYIEPNLIPSIAPTVTPTRTAIPSSTPTIEDLYDIPERYYQYGSIIPVGVSLETWLSQQEWTVEYKENDFDCSKMAAYIEWTLENSGYTTRIVLGEVYDDGAKYDHAWVEVKQDRKWRIIETTTFQFAYDDSMYFPTYNFNDIYQLAKKLYSNPPRPKEFRLEFAWWPKK